MTHAELCKLTAEWALKPPGADWLALYEYQSFASQEFPDVLSYSATGTRLYEIKISHSDFLADLKKPARCLKASSRIYSGVNDDLHRIVSEARRKSREGSLPPESVNVVERQAMHLQTFFNCWVEQDKTFQQAPHLGQRRWYVCEPGIIEKDEVPQGWGLIYYDPKNNKFREIIPSAPWKADVRIERDIIAHAMRRFASGDSTGIMIRTY